MTRPSEDDLIARYFAPIAGPAGLGLKDDAGLLAPPTGRDLVLTKDALVAGVHFFADDPPGSIAKKALRVNLSDLAAKGSRPLGFLLALALPPDWTADWLEAFARGLGEDAVKFSCPLIGGDTVSTPGPLTLSVTALGEVEAGRMVPRTGAKPGDIVYVSGTIGDATLALKLRGEPQPAWGAGLSTRQREALADRYLHPRPRLTLRKALHHAHAAMDVSDGLAGDLAKMLRASGVSGRLELARLPLSDGAAAAVAANGDVVELVVTGGDDYEVLCTVPFDQGGDFEREAQEAGVIVTAIGAVRDGSAPLVVVDAAGQSVRFDRLSYSHA